MDVQILEQFDLSCEDEPAAASLDEPDSLLLRLCVQLSDIREAKLLPVAARNPLADCMCFEVITLKSVAFRKVAFARVGGIMTLKG